MTAPEQEECPVCIHTRVCEFTRLIDCQNGACIYYLPISRVYPISRPYNEQAIREKVLEEYRGLKCGDIVSIKTPERGTTHARVTGFSKSGKYVGVEYWMSSFCKNGTVSTGVLFEDILGVCREIPCGKKNPPHVAELRHPKTRAEPNQQGEWKG